MNQKWINKKSINFRRVSQLLNNCQSTGQFTNGGQSVILLEDFVRNNFKIDDSKTVICVCNATVAIWVLCNAIELENEKIKWATQSFTFPSSAQGILKDVYIIDIDKDGGLDLSLVPNDCNGIIVTNVFGNVVNINKYVEWSKLNINFYYLIMLQLLIHFIKAKIVVIMVMGV